MEQAQPMPSLFTDRLVTDMSYIQATIGIFLMYHLSFQTSSLKSHSKDLGKVHLEKLMSHKSVKVMILYYQTHTLPAEIS